MLLARTIKIINGDGFSGRTVEILPLPPPIPTREIALLTHLGDLEVIASRLAQITRGVLRDVCLPELLRLAPWLKDQLQIV